MRWQQPNTAKRGASFPGTDRPGPVAAAGLDRTLRQPFRRPAVQVGGHQLHRLAGPQLSPQGRVRGDRHRRRRQPDLCRVPLLRDEIAHNGSATFLLDLLPDKSPEQVLVEVRHPRGSRTLSSHLKSRLGIEGIKAAMLHELLCRKR